MLCIVMSLTNLRIELSIETCQLSLLMKYQWSGMQNLSLSIIDFSFQHV